MDVCRDGDLGDEQCVDCVKGFFLKTPWRERVSRGELGAVGRNDGSDNGGEM